MLPPIPTTGTTAGAPAGSGVARAGGQAGGILSGLPGAPANVELIVEGALLDPGQAYWDEQYQNMMQLAGELHTLGVLARMIDGPTDEMRAAIADAAGKYFSNVMAAAQRSDWSGVDSTLDVVTIAGGAGLSFAGSLDQRVGRFIQRNSDEGGNVHAFGTWLEEFGAGETEVGKKIISTDPDVVLRKVAEDFLLSVWDDCKKRYNQFWKDAEREGLLSATTRLKADVDWLVAEIAIDVGLGIVTGGMAAAVSIIVKRTGRMASKVVFKLVAKALRSDKPSPKLDIKDNVFEMDLPDGNLDKKIVDQVMEENNLGTRSNGQDLSDRADVEKPDIERPEGGGGKDKPNAPPRKEDVSPLDGSYRNPADADGVRRTADGEAMIQNKEGVWRPVSEMADPKRVDGNGNPIKDDGRRHNPQVGNWGEVEADRYAASQGWEKIDGKPANIGDKAAGRNRIDAIYRIPGSKGPPLIPDRLVVADAKALGSQLSTMKDGTKQMSRKWIEDRLKNSDLSPADRRAIRRGYEPAVLKVDKNGNVTEEWLDRAGNAIDSPSWR